MIEKQQQKKILIVEDEETVKRALQDKLTDEGYQVLVAKNGEEGLSISLKEHPDLILLDLIMPVMDGLTMLEEVRADAWGRDARVVILTNITDSQEVAQATEVGGYDFLVKADWSIEDIAKHIRARLGTL